MKKIVILFTMLFALNYTYAQNKHSRLYEYPTTYISIGMGGIFPQDGSEDFGGFTIEIGRYLNGIFGIGGQFNTGWNSEFDDNLSFAGMNTRFKLNPYYNSNKLCSIEATAGFGYGWYNYNDWDFRKTCSYVVPKIGLDFRILIADDFSVGLNPEFAWYISTNKEKSNNVGVVNMFGKIVYNF